MGDKGILVTGNYCESPRLVPEEKHEVVPRAAQDAAPRAEGADALHRLPAGLQRRRRPPPSSHFDYGGPLTEIVLLGCLAERAGVGEEEQLQPRRRLLLRPRRYMAERVVVRKHVEWDAQKAEVTNLPELNRLVRREYRKGWELV